MTDEIKLSAIDVPELQEVPLPAHTHPFVPTHEQIAVEAYFAHERWVEESKWSPGAVDPGPEHFWFEAEGLLRIRHIG